MSSYFFHTMRVTWVCAALIAVAALAPRTDAQQTTTAKPQTVAAQPAPKAQPAAKREMIQLTVVKIRPEMLDQWLEFQKNETIPMLKKSGVPAREAWQTATFGEGFTYAFVTPIVNFADYDGDSPPCARSAPTSLRRSSGTCSASFPI